VHLEKALGVVFLGFIGLKIAYVEIIYVEVASLVVIGLANVVCLAFVILALMTVICNMVSEVDNFHACLVYCNLEKNKMVSFPIKFMNFSVHHFMFGQRWCWRFFSGTTPSRWGHNECGCLSGRRFSGRRRSADRPSGSRYSGRRLCGGRYSNR
jgi:hypothetical protein